MYQRNSKARYIIILLIDSLCIIAAMICAFYVRYGKDAKRIIHDNYFVQLLSISILVYIFIKLIIGIDYRFYINGYVIEALHVMRNNVLCFAGISALMYVLKWGESYSRLAIFYFLIINSILMYLMHILLKKLIPVIYEKFADKTRILIISESEWLIDIVDNINSMKDFGSKIIGIVIADDSIDDDKKSQVCNYKEVAKLSNVVEYCQQGYLDEVVVAVSRSRRKEIIPILNSLSEMGIVIHYHINLPELTGAKNKTLVRMGNQYMMTYATRIVSGGELAIKRCIDIFGALVGCIFFLIIIIIIGPLIKLESKGPIIFKQKRVGRNGRYFMMYKFRSMYQDAEERKKDLDAKNEMSGHMFKIENDPRITKVGKFIRKTSLDEFPQFWNVLKGDMSLVGTRPPTVDEFISYSPYHKKRLSFRPGITGLWQISGRNDITDFDKVVSLDVEYIDNWSILLDIKILMKTLGKMFTGK